MARARRLLSHCRVLHAFDAVQAKSTKHAVLKSENDTRSLLMNGLMKASLELIYVQCTSVV